MRSKKLVVAIIALAGLVIAAVAVVVTVHTARVTPKNNTGVEAEYVATTKTFPIPLPNGKSYPQSAPPQPAAGVHYQKGVGSAFVSFYNMCAWERDAVAAHKSGDTKDLKIALANLLHWNNLPVSISETDNSDHGWLNGVWKPAEAGNFGPMKSGIAGSCTGSFYGSATP